MIEFDKIYNEDCLVGMERIPDNSVDCVICDLPYGTTDCAWDSLIPIDKLWEQYKRVLKPQGSVLLFGSEPFSTMLRMSNLTWYKYDWIWHKNKTTGFQHAKNMPLKDYEIISVFSPASMGHANLLGERRMKYNPQGVRRVNKINHDRGSKFGTIVGHRPSHKESFLTEYDNYPRMILDFDSAVNGFHPTQKPVSLVRYLVLTYTNKDDVVLDNCMGSGTTAIACLEEHRHYIGFELNKEYFDMSQKRINDYSQQNKLFEL